MNKGHVSGKLKFLVLNTFGPEMTGMWLDFPPLLNLNVSIFIDSAYHLLFLPTCVY